MATSTGAGEPPAAAPVRGGHRGRTLLIGIVIMLVLAELFTRAIDSNLPAPLQWQSYETQHKVQEIDALSTHGGAQVVFFGSSLPDTGIDPAVIDREVGGGVTSYNAGLASSIPRMDKAWMESVVIPKLHPKVIVLGTSTYDLGSEDPNRTAFLNAFLASSGARAAMGTQTLIQRVDHWLGQVSALWFHKYQLRDPATVARAILGHPQPVDAEGVGVAADGRETFNQNASFVPEVGIDLKGWSIGTKDTDALKQLIAFAHQRHIEVVLVDMPVTPQFVQAMPQGEKDFQIFRHELAKIGSSTGSPVLYYDDSMRNDAYFQNDLHLNRTGAEKFSAKLGVALRPLIP
ncbi:MAG TPA: hypothetical protein VG298_11000 [Acidimicrobiales bacterium]|nr:hypothetical protein [Acidimicrobiales bacterium]